MHTKGATQKATNVQVPQSLVVFLPTSHTWRRRGKIPTKIFRPQEICWQLSEVWTEALARTGWYEADARDEGGPDSWEHD